MLSRKSRFTGDQKEAKFLARRSEFFKSVYSGLSPTAGQFFRYVIVGIGVNVIAYMLYVAITMAGFDPKLAATICFIIAMPIGFFLNCRWTFPKEGNVQRMVLKYLAAYAGAYACNVIGLFLFVDVLRYSHLVVQAGLILVMVAVLFLAQKFWIFSGTYRGNASNQFVER